MTMLGYSAVCAVIAIIAAWFGAPVAALLLAVLATIFLTVGARETWKE